MKIDLKKEFEQIIQIPFKICLTIRKMCLLRIV